MTATAVNENLIRRIECDVLDKHHRQLGLLCRNEATAIEALLRCYAQVLRDLGTGKIAKPSDDAKSQTANEGLRGLGHCLRWMRECCPSRLLVPTPGPNVLANEAIELLRWGVSYDVLYNHHTAFSRKIGGKRLIQATSDESHKGIMFIPRRDIDPRFFVSQVEAKKADDERRARAYPEQRLSELSRAWYDSATPSVRGLSCDDATIRSSGMLDVATEWMNGTFLPELCSSTALGDFTVGDLRRVLAAVHVISLLVTRLEDVADDQQETRAHLGSSVFVRRWDSTIAWLAALSDTPEVKVQAILSLLTFNDEPERVTVAHKPFVRSRDGRVFFLPRLILLLNLPQTFVGALNLSEAGQAAYSRVINQIENTGVSAIADQILSGALARLQIAVKRKFRLPDGTILTPDMVVVSSDAREVLVADVKHAAPPFGVADIWNDIWELEKTGKRKKGLKEQMSDYMAAFRQHPQILQQHFNSTADATLTVFGLILFRWPFPIPVDFTEPLCAVDWPSLREHLQQAHPTSIRDLMMWVYNRPDVIVRRALAWTTKQVNVGEWTYKYSVLAPLPTERAFELTQKLAYKLWKKRGRPLWDDLRDWYDAEERIGAHPYVADDMEL